jgi:hypothetical protein
MRRQRPNNYPPAFVAVLDPRQGDHVWFTRPSYRQPRSVSLIDRGVIRACSSGAVVVQTRSTNDGPILHIVPRHSRHALIGESRHPEREQATPPASPDQPPTINDKE